MQNDYQTENRSFFRSSWAPFLVGGCLILFLVTGRLLLDSWIAKSRQPAVSYPSPEAIKQIVQDVLIAHEVQWKLPSREGDLWQIHLPSDLPKTDLYVSLNKSLNAIHVCVLRAKGDPVSGHLKLELGFLDSCLFRLELIPAAFRRNNGRIALLIDDFGDRNDAFARSFFKLEGAITISVIPGLAHSREISELALGNGCEVVIHLPMEPLEGKYPDQGYTLITEMSAEQVAEIYRKARRILPGASGLNNHMGSKVTADRRIMGYLMEAMKSDELYFVDSRTTAASLAYDLALAAGMRCTKRDVFIDTVQKRESVEKSLEELAKIAEKNGTGVGIGHCYRITLEVLREKIPELKARGFRFVRVSEVVL
jgi:polysaccharide deacetylase 2 family uncharacterized protein YibQ